MFDEQQARHALRLVADEPPPPAVTSVTDVIRRGRRRVLAQRAGAVAGVVVVVAAIGATSLWLASAPADDSPGLNVATSTETTPNGGPSLPGWTKVDAPIQEIPTTETSESPLPPSGPESESPPAPKMCETQRRLPVPTGSVLLPRSRVENGFLGALASVTRAGLTVATSSWEDYSPSAGGARGYVDVVLPIGDGDETAHVSLENINYGGTPTEAADTDVSAYYNCEPPIRRVDQDGTVLQMYLSSAGVPQYLHVYRPDGRLYLVTVANSIDMPDGKGNVEVGAEWPLDTKQLAEFGERLVTYY